MSAKTSHRRAANTSATRTHVPLDLNAWEVIDSFGIMHTIYTLDEKAPEGFAKVTRLDSW